jgi:acetoin:2,6-dichlorophenolindophenol oxidoreductase subunit alpha
VTRWRERDPLLRVRAALTAAGADEAALDEIDSRTRSDVADLAQQVLGRPVPEPSGAWTDVWSDGSWQWRN